MSQRMGSRISSDRIARADARPTSGRPVTGYLTDEAHLRQFKLADDAPADAAMQAAWLAGHLHGCARRKRSDPPCPDPRHAEDMEAGRVVLDALRLLRPPEPEQVTG